MKKLLITLILISSQFVKSEGEGICIGDAARNACQSGYNCPSKNATGYCWLDRGASGPCTTDNDCRTRTWMDYNPYTRKWDKVVQGVYYDQCNKYCVKAEEAGKALVSNIEVQKQKLAQQAQKGGQDLKEALKKGKAAQAK